MEFLSNIVIYFFAGLLLGTVPWGEGALKFLSLILPDVFKPTSARPEELFENRLYVSGGMKALFEVFMLAFFTVMLSPAESAVAFATGAVFMRQYVFPRPLKKRLMMWSFFGALLAASFLMTVLLILFYRLCAHYTFHEDRAAFYTLILAPLLGAFLPADIAWTIGVVVLSFLMLFIHRARFISATKGSFQ